MGIGRLKIEAYTADHAIPLGNVRIKIKNQEGQVLQELITDESGLTPAVSLDAVDRKWSFDPEYDGEPYSKYIVEAEREGFNHLQIMDAHVFDGEDSIQPIELSQRLRSQTAPKTEEIYMGEHAVEMSEPREPAGPTVAPFALRHVIIPNPITVHLGTPTSSAPNIQVSFPDYIKNVASSEIYPTWPQAALEANIYVIITFALNRVFTQWYRSRGYNYDITNSTAYDQYFVPDRTIFESISKIVDRIFNQYVRRAGQIAPYFTSFCNGTTATCSGLSQWGTVPLANQGLTSFQILKRFYPNDIEISETNIITGIVEGFPGETLRLGSTGLAVQTMQTYLNRIRKNYPAIPLITDDAGTFGNTTQAAVKAFQNVFNMTADGVIGKATWNRISYIYVAVARLAELDSEGTALGIGTVPPNAILRVGSSGVNVITLQYILSFISEIHPNIPALPQDGVFGNATGQSVIAFQRMMGLSPDGIVGPATWNALYDMYWGIRTNAPIPKPPTAPPTEPPAGGSFEHTVRSGDTLWLLAQRFGTTVDAIRSLNNLTSDVLTIGQVLRIPGGATYHTVQSGDTLWLLAQRFGTTVAEIKRLNNLTSDALAIGQRLIIR